MSCNDFHGQNIQGVAAEALTKFRFGNLDGTTVVETRLISIADTTDLPLGIVPDTYASGDPAMLFINGEGRLEVLGAVSNIAVGDFLTGDAGSLGKGLKTTTNNAKYGAIALDPSVADGDVIRVLIVQGFVGA